MDSPFPPLSWGGIDDVVIVGGGLAGLFCALKLSPRPVTVIAATNLGEATSPAAPSGVAAAIGLGDTADDHVADTLAVGGGLADGRMVRVMAQEASDRVHDLLSYGVVFDRGRDGGLMLSGSARHSQPRVLRLSGPKIGEAMMRALIAAVRRTPSIRVLEGFVAERLRAEGQYVTGLVARDRRGGLSDRLLFPTRAVVLASGGIGHLFAFTTNPPEARGEGLAMAARAGALIADPEFVEFHPMALDIGRDPAPRANEALRTSGVTVVDRAGNRFLLEAHPDGELGPRALVARAVHQALEAGRGAFLDCRKAAGRDFTARFPAVHAACLEAGIDPAEQPIPIAPAAHYHLGGVHVDGSCRTTLDGLWACGEVASTGVHGADRLTANSLVEAVVFAARAAEDIQGQLPNHKVTRWSDPPDRDAPGPEQEDAAIRRLRATMTRNVGVVRDRAGLTGALAEFDALDARTGSPRVKNAATVAKLVAAAALAREESRGSHFRSDFPGPAGAGARAFLRLAKAAAAARATSESVQKKP